MNKDYYAVIMAGGIGSRFWPVSTEVFPKQFHDMLGTGQTLLQKTFSRLNKIIPSENIYILTNEMYLEITLKQLPEISEKQVVLEPAMRNTAPCILLSALKIKKRNPNAIMLVAPSDHWIEDERAFAQDVQACFDAAQRDDILLTLGIEPTFPNTGFGYIESDKNDSSEIKKVKQFCEKPDYETAKQFLNAGNFLWNAGIFIWSAKNIVASFEKHLTEMNSLFSKGMAFLNTSEEKIFIEENYSEAQNISIDYGILEKADNVYLKKATFDWNDLGTWGALYDKLEKDENNNSVVNAETFVKDSKNNMIFMASKKLVVLDGIEDYIVVDKEDVLLLFPKQKEQEIKELLKEVSKKFGKKYL
ncbi:mannose-1-phosphate guanylyltransferase [Aequorivita sublithincola DSM 14238]|uniref:mannose-1-phosphate guanylyltransferase n=1 Tax=Aequorivita sublithincola (strain DSM 14238 / LMG 21431 / ACAM 643 / 9-3) TaxID=746697 RepID=I3YW41_AEQSU|nr:mannose-1-phosphate guanylyltransferase [Aequorivita sublithincola]AFL81209.1 mannose-1-phosphate guanylyltransferase [Aequorivita sublithincola DSM 14238]